MLLEVNSLWERLCRATRHDNVPKTYTAGYKVSDDNEVMGH